MVEEVEAQLVAGVDASESGVGGVVDFEAPAIDPLVVWEVDLAGLVKGQARA